MSLDLNSTLNSIANFSQVYGLKFLTGIIILVVGLSLIKVTTNIIEKTLTLRKVDPTLIPFLKGLSSISLKVALFISILGTVGVKTTSFIAILGSAGLAIGLAMQGSLSHFAGGVLLLIFRPFKVDDFIETMGHSGTVYEIGIISTKMRTPDNKVIIIPNGPLAGSSIINYSAEETRRVDWVFGISYDDDLKKAQSLLLKALEEDERILKDKPLFARVEALADSSVNFKVRAWVNSADYWDLYFDYLEKIKLSFDAENITFPFPQRDLHILKES